MRVPRFSYSKLYKYSYRRGYLMQISVSGLRSKKYTRLMARAAEFYASLLITKRMAETVDLRIVCKNKLDDNAEGYCQFISKDIGYREFEIEIEKNKPIEELLQVLAHEMVHLKQFATKELSNNLVPANISRWQGKNINEDLVNYWDLPWEIEAHGREKGLFYRFLDSYDIYK